VPLRAPSRCQTSVTKDDRRHPVGAATRIKEAMRLRLLLFWATVVAIDLLLLVGCGKGKY
jgi:hypothetical protein